MKQAAFDALGSRKLGNKFLWQFVIELGKFKARVHA
jgi:hypothetical protein